MAERPVTMTSSYLLLVEGNEEKYFWEVMLRKWGRTDVQVQPAGGRDSLRARLSVLVRTPGFDDVIWLGIAQDADDNPNGTFQRIANVLRLEGLPVPNRPWMPTGSSRVIVALVLPDGVSEGDLETLVWRALAQEPAIPCVNAYFDCLESVGVRRPRQISKALVHAYLASLERPDFRLGDAARAGALPLDELVFERVRNLLP